MSEPEAIASLAAALEGSKKYGEVHPATLRRAAAWALRRTKSLRPAEKLARQKLHQICGAFATPATHKKLEAAVEALPPLDHADHRRACEAILTRHQSTAERLPVMAEFWNAIRAAVPAPLSIVDLGAGLNPFALAWMGWDTVSRYLAVDADRRVTRLAARYFQRFYPPGAAQWADALEFEFPAADLVFAFKLLPTLEQQEPGAGAALIGNCSGAIIATFPLRTFGGRDAGMARNYREYLSGVLRRAGRTAREFAIGRELVCIVEARK